MVRTIPDLIQTLEKVYEWRQSQAISRASACFTHAGLILSPLLAAVLDPKADVQLWQAALYLLGFCLAASGGVRSHRQATELQDAFESEMLALASPNPSVPGPGEGE